MVPLARGSLTFAKPTKRRDSGDPFFDMSKKRTLACGFTVCANRARVAIKKWFEIWCANDKTDVFAKLGSVGAEFF